MCSGVVGPDAPKASVTLGAARRTPKVKTPETTWLSAETTRQRTVYPPRGRLRTGTVTIRLSVPPRARPETIVPLAV